MFSDECRKFSIETSFPKNDNISFCDIALKTLLYIKKKTRITKTKITKKNKKQKPQYIAQLLYHIKIFLEELDTRSLIINMISQKTSIIISLHNLISQFSS